MGLEKRKVAMLLADKFQDEEATEPKQFLEQHGVTVEVVGLKKGEVTGKNGRAKVKIDRTIDEVTPAEYDAVIIPGGSSPERLRINEDVVRFVQLFWETGKPIAAICHGPQVLISAGLLGGKRITSYVGIRDDVKLAGAEWVDEPVVRDGQLITSRVPQDLPKFNEAILEALRELDRREKWEIGPDTDPLEALRVAVSREKGAYDFYTAAAQQFEEERLKNKFEYLAAIEKGHWDDLAGLYRRLSGGKEPELIVHENELNKQLVTPDLTPEQATELAIRAEELAYEFYRRAADLARNEKAKELFLHLASEELEHKRLLAHDLAAETRGRSFQMATYFDIPPGSEGLW